MMIALLLAQVAAPAATCPAFDRSLPPALAPWAKPGGEVAIGKAATLTAHAPATPDAKRPGGGAEASFAVARAGTYRVALDQPGWIDVQPVGGAAPLVSVSHGHGPACSTIRKLVAFRLEAGRYRLTLSGLQQPRAKVMIVAGE